MVGPSGLFPSPSRRGFLVQPVCSFTYGFWRPSLMCTWTPCLTYSRSPRPTCKRRVKLLYKGLYCSIENKRKNIVIFALCFVVCQQLREKVRARKRKYFFLLFLFSFGLSENWV